MLEAAAAIGVDEVAEQGAGGASHPGAARGLRAHRAPVTHQCGPRCRAGDDGENQDEEDAVADPR